MDCAGTTKLQALPAYHLAHRQNIPDLLRHDVDRYKIKVGLAIGDLSAIQRMEYIRRIQIAFRLGTRLHLYAPKVFPGFQNEVIAVVVAVGLGHHEAQTHGFVHKGYFAEITLLEDLEATRSPCLPDRAPLARSDASTRTALGFAHGLKWESTAKRKGAS